MVRVADCVRCCWPTRWPASSAPSTAGRPGLALGVVPRRRAMRDAGAAGSWPGSGRTCAAAATRCPSSCATRSRRRVPAAYAETTWGTPPLDIGAGRARPARAPPASRSSTSAGCTREDARPATPTAATAPPRAASPDWCGCRDVDEPGRRDRAPAWRRSARGSPRPAPTPAATPDEVALVVVTKFFPASDVRLLADLGVTDVGENRHQEAEAKAAECADLGLAGTSSAACRATRRPRSRRTPTSWSPSTGPSSSRRWPRGRTARPRRSTCCSRSASTRPGAAGRAGRRPGRPGRAGRPRSAAAEGAAAARADGRGAARRGPRGGVRAAGRDPPDFLAEHPDATWLSAGMSGDLEARRSAPARHTCVSARAVLGPRPAIK